jgi:hypothetical protein
MQTDIINAASMTTPIKMDTEVIIWTILFDTFDTS